MSEGIDRVDLFIMENDGEKDSDKKIRAAAREYINKIHPELSEINEESLFSVSRTERGKPYFANCPELFFSVSHSEAYWVCALAEFPVGVDIQSYSRLKHESEEAYLQRLKSIGRRFFHPKEARYLEEISTESRFYFLWTARESYVKWTGKGIDDDFSQFCILSDHPSFIPASVDEKPFFWSALGANFVAMQFQSSYTLCVCSDRKASLQLSFLPSK